MASREGNINDVNAEARLQLVRRTLNHAYGVKVRSICPIAYENGSPFPYNNFVYAVDIDQSGLPERPGLPKQPGTQAAPATETTLIFRMPNPVSGYNDAVRVENEVAALSLAREALQPSLHHLVPRVYAWNTARYGEGWILQQRISGDGLLHSFSAFSIDDKANVLSQMADILACFQQFRLPATIDKYGGVGFDEQGEYISTPLSMYNAGPFESYEDLLRATISYKLEQADRDPRVKGWRDRGVRERLDTFLAQGLPIILHDTPPFDRILVHGDFSIDNVLFDTSTKKLTALLDFDFSQVSSIADEFFRSLGHGIGRFPSRRDGNAETTKLHNAMLHGFPNPLPPNSDKVDWAAAKAWDDALRDRTLQRPATIPGIVDLADVFWLSAQILPFKLCNGVVVVNSTEEQLERRKQEGEALLERFLADFGH